MTDCTINAPFSAPALAMLGCAGLAGLLAGGSALAAADPAAEAASAQTRSMILGPLYEEFSADVARQPGARLAAGPRAAQARFSPSAGASGDGWSPRPAAARFAGAALTARADSVTRDGLSAFAGEEAVLAATPSGGRVSLAMFDTANPNAAVLGFDPDYAASAGLALNREHAFDQRMAVRYETSFDARGADGMDYGLAPRAGVSVTQDGAALETGATVRLGRYIDTDFDRPAWWFFAGADRQAVMYDPGQGFDVRGAVAMEPYAIVGDAQAGVAMRMGGADVSLAYIHRETEFAMPNESWETREGFAAFSLTWRR